MLHLIGEGNQVKSLLLIILPIEYSVKEDLISFRLMRLVRQWVVVGMVFQRRLQDSRSSFSMKHERCLGLSSTDHTFILHKLS
jgi:hypothetical protein